MSSKAGSRAYLEAENIVSQDQEAWPDGSRGGNTSQEILSITDILGLLTHVTMEEDGRDVSAIPEAQIQKA